MNAHTLKRNAILAKGRYRHKGVARTQGDNETIDVATVIPLGTPDLWRVERGRTPYL